MIAVWLERIFRLDDLPDVLSYAFGGDEISVGLVDRATEKELQLKEPLLRVNPFACGGSADGRFVHLNVVNHFTKHEWLEVGDPVIKKFFLNLKSLLFG